MLALIDKLILLDISKRGCKENSECEIKRAETICCFVCTLARKTGMEPLVIGHLHIFDLDDDEKRRHVNNHVLCCYSAV